MCSGIVYVTHGVMAKFARIPVIGTIEITRPIEPFKTVEKTFYRGEVWVVVLSDNDRHRDLRSLIKRHFVTFVVLIHLTFALSAAICLYIKVYKVDLN